MHPANFQIKSILHSYETKSPLVYSKSDGCFYSVGSIKKLNKQDYETHPQVVHSKIQEFVVNNQPFFHQDVLSSLSTTLEKHVQQIVAWTSNILALFYYFFNPQSKSRLVERKHLMEDLKSTIDSAIAQLKQKPKIEDDDDEIEPEYPTLSQLLLPTLPQLPLPLSPLKPQKLTIFGPPLQLSQRHLASPLPPSKSTKAQTPIQVPQLPVPIPPPPPPIPKFNLHSYSLPKEPPALSFDPLHYKKLTDHEIARQIPLIEDYVQKLQEALEPIKEQVRLAQEIPSYLQELRGELQELTSQINRCEENLARLREGDEKEQIILLAYKSGDKLIPLPYIPDNTYTAIQDKHKELEDANRARRVLLEAKVHDQKPLLENKEQELLSTPSEELQEEVEKMRKELQDDQEELEQILAKPSFDKRLLHSSLRISDAIEIFDDVMTKLQKHQKKMQTNCEALEQKLKELQEFRYNNLNLTELEKVVATKIKLIDKWERYKNSREQWLKQKADNRGAYKAPRREGEEPLQPDIIKVYPSLQHLLNLPQQVLVLLRGNHLREGDITDSFKSSLYAQLYPYLDTKDTKNS